MVRALMESSKTGGSTGRAFAPLIQNYNSYYRMVSGIAAQNTGTATHSLQRRFRSSGGSICRDWSSNIAPDHSVIDVLPPGQSASCPAVLSARLRNQDGGGVSATVNQFWSGYSPYPNYWTDYPAVSNPSTEVIIPWWKDGAGWDSAMVIRNPGSITTSGRVRFFYANGSPAGKRVNFSIPGYGYAIVDAPISSMTGSAKVTSSRDVAVIVNHFNAGGGGDKIMSNSGDHKP